MFMGAALPHGGAVFCILYVFVKKNVEKHPILVQKSVRNSCVFVKKSVILQRKT